MSRTLITLPLSQLTHTEKVSSLCCAVARDECAIGWARHLYHAAPVQCIRIMHHSHLKLHSKIRLDIVHNSIPLLLLLQPDRKIRLQIHQARQQMNLYQPHFPRPLPERLHNLARNQTAREVELDVEVLELDSQFPVRVREVCKECDVSVEKLWGVEVDHAEGRCRDVQDRAPRLDPHEDDERGDAEEDEEEAEDEAQDCPKPHHRISPAPRPQADRLLWNMVMVSCLFW